MRNCLMLGLILACQTGRLCAQPAEDAAATEKRVAELVTQLGHATFPKRNSATELLAEIGEMALPALRAAVRNSDSPEVQRRAQQAITKILIRSKRSKSTSLELEVVKAGTFAMGSPKTEPGRRPDETSHRVQIARPLLLGKYEVTQTQFEKVMTSRPSGFREPGMDTKKEPTDERDFPVEQVSWYDAVEFCNRLSKRDGFETCYTLSDLKFKGKSIISAKVIANKGNGYRLPTEAEWEYACRAGTTTPYYFGVRNTGKQSNVKASKRKGSYGILSKGWKDKNRTTPVGSYPANTWGLHDMLGNVAEWVDDWYDKDYGRNSTSRVSGRHRVLRGGSWLLTESHARSASRYYHTPDERKNYVGFRVARTP